MIITLNESETSLLEKDQQFIELARGSKSIEESATDLMGFVVFLVLETRVQLLLKP